MKTKKRYLRRELGNIWVFINTAATILWATINDYTPTLKNILIYVGVWAFIGINWWLISKCVNPKYYFE